MPFLSRHPRGFALKVFVQPRSSKNEIAGLYDGALKVKLTAPPVGGEANRMCIRYLAKCLDLPRSSLDIISGHTSRRKTVLVQHQDRKSAQAEQDRLKRMIEKLIPKKTS